MLGDRVDSAGPNNTVKKGKERGSSDKQQLHQEVVTSLAELEESVSARGGVQWESDRGTKGDQKRLHRFDGCAAVTIDGIRQKESIVGQLTKLSLQL